MQPKGGPPNNIILEQLFPRMLRRWIPLNATQTWITVLLTKLCESPLPAITMHLWLFIRCFSYGDKQVRRVNFVCSLVGASEVHKNNIPPLKDAIIAISYLRGLRRSADFLGWLWIRNHARMVPKLTEHDSEIPRTWYNNHTKIIGYRIMSASNTFSGLRQNTLICI